jgi:hypothetical protein
MSIFRRLTLKLEREGIQDSALYLFWALRTNRSERKVPGKLAASEMAVQMVEKS